MSVSGRRLSGLTVSQKNAVFSAGSTSTYTTTTTTECLIGGKYATALTAQTNTATPTTDATTGAAFRALDDNQATVLVFGINAAGAIQMSQGSIEDTEVGVTTTAGAFKVLPDWPPLPDDFCPLAYCLVRTAPSASAFTPGTSSWTATGITTSTFTNVGTLPERPQSS